METFLQANYSHLVFETVNIAPSPKSIPFRIQSEFPRETAEKLHTANFSVPSKFVGGNWRRIKNFSSSLWKIKDGSAIWKSYFQFFRSKMRCWLPKNISCGIITLYHKCSTNFIVNRCFELLQFNFVGTTRSNYILKERRVKLKSFAICILRNCYVKQFFVLLTFSLHLRGPFSFCLGFINFLGISIDWYVGFKNIAQKIVTTCYSCYSCFL